jgi:hypothetical protein
MLAQRQTSTVSAKSRAIPARQAPPCMMISVGARAFLGHIKIKLLDLRAP